MINKTLLISKFKKFWFISDSILIIIHLSIVIIHETFMLLAVYHLHSVLKVKLELSSFKYDKYLSENFFNLI